jgi:hypothetical protein
MIRRLLPLSGIVFVVGVIVGIVVIGGNTPDIKSSATKIASFYSTHHSKQTLAVYFVFWATPFLIFFAAGLGAAIWAGTSLRDNVWQLVLIGGSVVSAAGFLVAAGVHYALADAGKHHLPTAAMQALNALDADNYLVFVGGLGVMMLGAAGAMIPRSDAYRWFGWASLVLGVGIFTPVGFFAMLLTALWIVVVSIVSFRQQPLVDTAAPQPI